VTARSRRTQTINVEISRRADFEQQRDDHCRQPTAFLAPLREPRPAKRFMNAGMNDGFELFAPGIIRKHAPGKFVPPQPAVSADQFRAKMFFNLHQRRLTRFDHFAREHVGVDDRHATRREQFPTPWICPCRRRR